MKKRWIFLMALVGLLALGASPARAQLRTVKIALTSHENMDNLPYFVGIKAGFFQEAGINLEPSYFRGGGDVVRAVTTRATDLAGSAAPSAVFIAASRGEPIKVVSGHVNQLVIVWVVKANSPFKSIKDLKGKKIGFSSPGSVTHTTVQAILKAEGMEKDVEIVRAGTPGENWTAVNNGVIDVGWHVSPGVYNLVSKGEARILITASNYIKDYQQTVVAAMDDVIGKHPDMIRNVLRAKAKAVKFIQENPEKTISIWTEELKLPVEILRLAYKDLPKGVYDVGAPKTESLQGAMREAIGAGGMKEPLDLKKVTDFRFLP
jgi:NitT/TauT family transport system substrate-binding protein